MIVSGLVHLPFEDLQLVINRKASTCVQPVKL